MSRETELIAELRAEDTLLCTRAAMALEAAIRERDEARESWKWAVAAYEQEVARVDPAISEIKRLTAERDAAQARAVKADKAFRECSADNARIYGLLTTAEARIASLEEALTPFSDMGGEMFARGWDASNVALALDNPDDPHRVSAGDFFRARRTLSEQSRAPLSPGEAK